MSTATEDRAKESTTLICCDASADKVQIFAAVTPPPRDKGLPWKSRTRPIVEGVEILRSKYGCVSGSQTRRSATRLRTSPVLEQLDLKMRVSSCIRTLAAALARSVAARASSPPDVTDAAFCGMSRSLGKKKIGAIKISLEAFAQHTEHSITTTEGTVDAILFVEACAPDQRAVACVLVTSRRDGEPSIRLSKSNLRRRSKRQ